jgi:hypothetical protein
METKKYILITKEQEAIIEGLGLSKANRIRLYKYLSRLRLKVVKMGSGLDQPIGMAQQYLKEAFGGGNYYRNFLKPAKDSGLVLCDLEKIQGGRVAGKAYAYWMNPDYLSQNYTKVPIFKKQKRSEKKLNEQEFINVNLNWIYNGNSIRNAIVCTSDNNTDSIMLCSNLFSTNSKPMQLKATLIKNNLLCLLVDEAKLRAFYPTWVKEVDDKLLFFCTEDFNLLKTLTLPHGKVSHNPNLFDVVVEGEIHTLKRGDLNMLSGMITVLIRGEGRRKDYLVHEALSIAKKKEMVLIKYGREYYVDTLPIFVYSKKAYMLDYLERSILSLRDPDLIYHNRNPTNNRLDHNLTSMPGWMVKVIMKDNDLVEIDICNSQFTC